MSYLALEKKVDSNWVKDKTASLQFSNSDPYCPPCSVITEQKASC